MLFCLENSNSEFWKTTRNAMINGISHFWHLLLLFLCLAPRILWQIPIDKFCAVFLSSIVVWMVVLLSHRNSSRAQLVFFRWRTRNRFYFSHRFVRLSVNSVCLHKNSLEKRSRECSTVISELVFRFLVLHSHNGAKWEPESERWRRERRGGKEEEERRKRKTEKPQILWPIQKFHWLRELWNSWCVCGCVCVWRSWCASDWACGWLLRAQRNPQRQREEKGPNETNGTENVVV